MKTIAEQIVYQTWRNIAQYNDIQARRAISQLGKKQPELLAFIIEMSQGFDPDSTELTVYMFLVIYSIFESAYDRTISSISADDIMNVYEQNEHMVLNLENVHDRFLERIASIQLSIQPNVMHYILETLFEEPFYDEDDLDLTDEQVGNIFLMMKTLVDVLNNKTEH